MVISACAFESALADRRLAGSFDMDVERGAPGQDVRVRRPEAQPANPPGLRDFGREEKESEERASVKPSLQTVQKDSKTVNSRVLANSVMAAFQVSE